MVDVLFGELILLPSKFSINLVFLRFDTLNPSVTHIIRGSESTLNYSQVSINAPK